MKIFQGPIWNFWNAVFAFLAIIVAVILFQLNRSVKDLQIEVLSNSPLISVEGDIAKDIEILYKDQPVRTLSVILLRIENTGNTPIRETDYSRPILISVSPDAEVGEFSIVETKPEDMGLSLEKITPYQVELSKSLLNPGDQALVRILVLDNDGTLDVGARIADISELRILSVLEEQGSSEQQSQRIDLVTFLLILIFTSLLFSPLIFWDRRVGIQLRQKFFGLEPAPYLYGLAQETIMGRTTGYVRFALGYLKEAFRWDNTYVQKAQNDPLFTNLREYEGFKALIEKYNSLHSETHETKRTTPQERSADY